MQKITPQILLRAAIALLLMLAMRLTAPVPPPGAFAMSAAEPVDLSNGALLPITLSEAAPAEYTFIPAANGLYGVYLFSESAASPENVVAQILENGEPVAAEALQSSARITCRLTAGVQYTLRLTGSGAGLLEVAREALSRSFSAPLELSESYTKLIAREGDAHWYTLRPDERTAALFSAMPQSPELRLRAWLFDEDGALLQQSEALEPGAAVLGAELQPSRTYYLRLAAVDTNIGKYTLSCSQSANLLAPESLSFSDSALTFTGHARTSLEIQRTSRDSASLLLLTSSDPGVLRVHPDGTVETYRAGEVVVTAYAYGGAQAQCKITVENVPVESVTLYREALEMRVGDQLTLNVSLAPENALNRRVTFVTENERVVEVDRRGKLTAVGEGTAKVVVVTEDGGFTDMAFVTVTPAPRRYRALLVGEQNYASTVDEVRPGSINSVESIGKLLRTASFDGEGFEVSTLLDAPRDDVIAAIRTAFQDAGPDDVSLLYITCHGFYQAGMTFFAMADGSVLSARDLERELRQIPGKIVLLADCCGSGGLLGEAGSTDDLLDGIASVFQGTVGAPSVIGSKYRVIASALLDQDSYRISFSDDSEAGMATVFARALCDGAGWSIDRNARAAMNADANYDGDVTLTELGSYMARRTSWYLNLAGGYVQNVRTYPEGDGFVLFSRKSQ